MKPPLYIGLISGTSVDGVDCALISAEDDRIQLLDFLTQPMPATLRDRILELCRSGEAALTQLGALDVELGRYFAEVVHHMLDRQQVSHDQICAIGSHGQTVWHQPPINDLENFTPFTLQLADPNTICQQTRITTVADFRRKDMAAGGQGAPIVPALHRVYFHNPDSDRIVVNIGGISNITVLCKDGVLPVQGYDTGPGNVLLDYWIQKNRDDTIDFNGDWAAGGNSHDDLLHHLLDEPYFHLEPPKSTGRELFNGAWLEQKLGSMPEGLKLKPEDIQATLVLLTAYSIAAVITQIFPEGEVVVCGGGSRNRELMRCLQEQLPAFRVMDSSKLGLDPDAVEATAFAWMAGKTLRREPIDFTTITGASEPGIAGGIYYYE